MVEKEVCLMFHNETEMHIPKRPTVGTISAVSSVIEQFRPVSVSIPRQNTHQPAQDDWDPPVNLEGLFKSDKYCMRSMRPSREIMVN